MDPHLLRTFTAVARLGSFSAAARELGYTQSAVSQHIAALEADLGVALLGRRPVTPTEAGARLLDHAGPLLIRLAAARADVARTGHAPRVRLAVGICGQAFGPDTARALAAVQDAMPRARLSLARIGRGEAARAVASGDLDVALVDGAVAPSDPLRIPAAAGLRTRLVGEEPLAVLLPPGHPLAGRAGLRLADLTDALWVEAPDAAVPTADLRAAEPGGFPAALRCAGADARMLHDLVAAGHGIAVLARSAAGARGVPLTEPRLVHRVEALHRRAGDPAVALLVEAVAGR